MIQLYPKGQTDFSRNGIELAPAENEVTWQNGGRYDFIMNIPREMAENVAFDYGQILKVSVPPQIVGPISLGTVSYYTTNKSTKLYSQIPTLQRVSYKEWNYTVMGAQVNYSVGAKVTYSRQNYQCTNWDSSSPWVIVPPGSGHPFWTQIPNTIGSAGKEIATLESGTSIMKVRDFNATYMEAATLTGKQGYIKIEDCDATGTSEERIIPQFEITEQLFTIKKIDKVTDAHNIQIEAEHYSYMLGRTMLGECNVAGVNPATALIFIQGAMKEDYPGNLYCGESEGTIDADWSWGNAQKAILDPSSGLLKVSGMQAVRDNLDVYIVPAEEETPAYEIAYGRNMKTVHWTGDVGNIVTRVYPLAQREDGTRMTLPEEYIDTELTVPYCRPVTLDTKLKIGQKVTNSDGTEVELTESEVYTRMRQAAQDLFDIDHADQAEVTLALDFVHMPDTEEYKQYLNMRNVAPMEWVRVTGGPMGIETVIQMTGYTWDAIRLEYKSTKYGDKKQKATVSGYDIKSGAVSGRALAAGAVGSEHIKAGSITAREIEAGSITADQIASRIITAELIAAKAITATEIAANAVTAEKIKAGEINADHIAAAAVDAINAKLHTAVIDNGYIANAYLEYARIKAATAESLIARDAVTDRYFIDKLQVRNVQAVEATVGELVIKAADSKYYRLDIDENGELSPTEVTLTAAEIAAGVTSNGHGAIIETDLTVNDLSASNIKGINALIDKITAARIDVDELFARTAFMNKISPIVNAKSKTYRQWATPSDPHEGDIWYKQGPQPISEMENYTMSGLEAFPMWAFDGYQLYRYEGNAWRKIDDEAEIRNTITEILLSEGRIELQVAQLDTEMDNKYTVRSGIAIELAGIEISGSKYIKIKSGGSFAVDSGNFAIDESGNVSMTGSVTASAGQIGGYSIGATRLSSGSSTTFVGLDSGTANFDYAIWAGAETAASAPFRLKRDGTLTVTKLEILDESSSAETINLRNYALWKLTYHPIKTVTSSGGYVSSMDIEGIGTVNFSRAASVDATAAEVATSGPLSRTWYINVGLSNGKTTQNLPLPVGNQIDACETYYEIEGWNDCLDNCSGDWYLTGYQSIGYGTMGYMDSSNVFHPMGTGNWYLGGSTVERYTIPGAKQH